MTTTAPAPQPVQKAPSRASRRARAPRGAVLVAAALLLSACSSDAPGPQPTTDASSPDATSAAPDAVAYAQCMRDNGVPGFPDPNSSGEFAITSDTLGVSLESEQYLDAEQTCAPLLPLRNTDPEQQEADYQARLAYAQCLRDEGVTDFPDPPAPTDGPHVESNSAGSEQGGPDVDLDSAQFQAAHAACKDLLPEGDEGPSLSDGPNP